MKTSKTEFNGYSRERKNKIFLGVIIVLSFLTVVPIIFIVGKIIISGIGQINFDFFTSTSPDTLQAMTAIANGQKIPEESPTG